MKETLLKPLHLACKVDEKSPNKRLIEIRRGIATASNGIILARLDLREQYTTIEPEQLELLDGKHIDMEVWKDIHDADEITFTAEAIHCEKKGINKAFEYSEPNGVFFNLDSLIITIADAGESAQVFTRYNLRQLELLRKIFQVEELTMAQSAGNVGTLVWPDTNSGAFGVIMPVQIFDTEKRYYFLT